MIKTKKYDVSKFTIAAVRYNSYGAIHLLVETEIGKYDISNKRWLKDCVIFYERPLTDYINISENKLTFKQARGYTTEEVINAFYKDYNDYCNSAEGRKKDRDVSDYIHSYGVDGVINEF